MFPYVSRVQMHPNNWMIHSQCLLLKCRLEAEKSRTADRSLLQLQVLVSQFEDESNRVDEEPGKKIPRTAEAVQAAVAEAAKERMEFFFSLSYPTLHDLRKELGQSFLRLGAAKSALEIFEPLEMWDQIVDCYVVMQDMETAEDVIRKRLVAEPSSPRLWCILADVTENAEYYIRSWQISGNRYSRAARSLAHLLLRRGDVDGAIQYFEQSLAISPLYPSSWFSLGCCYMQREMWQKSLAAFTRVIQIEPEESEAWANMGSIYIGLKEMEKAFQVLQEALRGQPENWKMWENFLHVSMELGEVNYVIVAINRLLELREKSVDFSIVSTLIRLFSELLKKKDSQELALSLQQKIASILERITQSSMSTDPRSWDLCVQFYQATGNQEQILESRKKQVRYLQVADWDRDYAKFSKVAGAMIVLAD